MDFIFQANVWVEPIAMEAATKDGEYKELCFYTGSNTILEHIMAY